MIETKLKDFTQLNAWKSSHKLVLLTYQIVKTFPNTELFALSSQIKRASISVTSNIAEGFGRQSTKDKLHFYVMARGSILEVQSQLIAAKDLKFISEDYYKNVYRQSIECNKILNGLIKSIQNKFS